MWPSAFENLYDPSGLYSVQEFCELCDEELLPWSLCMECEALSDVSGASAQALREVLFGYCEEVHYEEMLERSLCVEHSPLQLVRQKEVEWTSSAV